MARGRPPPPAGLLGPQVDVHIAAEAATSTASCSSAGPTSPRWCCTRRGRRAWPRRGWCWCASFAPRDGWLRARAAGDPRSMAGPRWSRWPPRSWRRSWASTWIPPGWSRWGRGSSRRLSAHQGPSSGSALAPEEVDHFVQNPGPYGHAGSSEVTWPEVVTVGALLAGSDVDWANMGMILAALGPR
ncbi:MAG: hypothetical protein R3F43_20035 [bacterium]